MVEVGDVVVLENGNRYLITNCDPNRNNVDKLMPCAIGLNSQGIPREIPISQIKETIFNDSVFVDLMFHMDEL